MPSEHATEDILDFWFGKATDAKRVAQQQNPLWWSKNAAIDAEIRTRFEPRLLALAAEAPGAAPATARDRLARIVLFDQMPRNMYRGTPAAFATDPLARQLALAALDTSDEAALRPIERVFLYMPLEHAEDRALQAESVARYHALRDAAPDDERPLFQGYLDFAIRHRDIVERFGRFPHRNALLGRPSTPEEIEFLQQPGSSF